MRRCWPLFLLTLLLGACQCEPAWQAVEVPGSDLQLRLPPGWRVERSPGSALYVRPVEQGRPVPAAFLLLASDPMREGAPGGTLAQYRRYKDLQLGASLIEDRRLALRYATVANHPAWISDHRGHDRLQQRRSLRAVWLDEAGNGWLMVGSADPRDFPRLKAVYRRILDSVQHHAG